MPSSRPPSRPSTKQSTRPLAQPLARPFIISKTPKSLSWATLGTHLPSVRQRIAALSDEGFAARFWAKDPTLWSDDPQVCRGIANRLGWLSVLQPMRADCRILRSFADEVRQAGYTHALLLGMGGSSLCAEVCRETFGVAPGFLDLAVLDSTDPAAVRRAERRAPLDKTLFLVATKSGGTTETLCFFRYFYEKVRKHSGDAAGRQFVAITDPGSPLVALGAEHRFRRTFLNPSDIGGRYSALSYFGLLPAALIGVRIEELIDRAAALLPGVGSSAQGAGNEAPGDDAVAIQMGAALGQLALAGRNKVTLHLSREIASFGHWVEQLIAESTGKMGKGLFPVVGEPLGKPTAYGQDRVFVEMRMTGSRDAAAVSALQALGKAGHPVIRMELGDRLDLGREFLRWEIITAVAASICRINAFDEPNVKESKDNTERILKEATSEGGLPAEKPIAQDRSISLFAAQLSTRDTPPSREAPRKGRGKPDPIQANVEALLREAKPGDYLAILAYLTPSPGADKLLARLRTVTRDRLGIATSAGYGPRYLHSTGQFHKGGPASGIFLEITMKDSTDVPIPSRPYTFSTLKQAQALGDREALESRGRRFLHAHLRGKPEAGLARLVRCFEAALPTRARARRPGKGR